MLRYDTRGHGRSDAPAGPYSWDDLVGDAIGLAERAQALGAFCRYHTSLPSRLTELAILVTGAHWRAGFEWFVHAPIAIEAGIHPDTVEAIRTGRARSV